MFHEVRMAILPSASLAEMFAEWHEIAKALAEPPRKGQRPRLLSYALAGHEKPARSLHFGGWITRRRTYPRSEPAGSPTAFAS